MPPPTELLGFIKSVSSSAQAFSTTETRLGKKPTGHRFSFSSPVSFNLSQLGLGSRHLHLLYATATSHNMCPLCQVLDRHS